MEQNFDQRANHLTGLGMPMPATIIVLTPVHPALQGPIEELRGLPSTVWSSTDPSVLAQETPDLVLVAPPEPRDSPAIAQRLRDHWQNQLVPTVVLLPPGQGDVLVQAYAVGVDFVWSAEAPVAALRARVGSLLRLRSVVALLVKSRNRAKDRVEDHHRWARFLVHDMRNPLAAVSAGLDWLRSCESLGAEDRAFCDQMSHEIRRLSSMVSDLLDHERLTKGSLQLDRQPTNLADLLKAIVNGCQPVATGRRVRLRLTLGGVDPVLRADAKLMERVVENLMSNALRHSPENQVVDVQLAASPRSATIMVLNSGPPIPVALREKIFEPYVQIEGSTSQGASGLGLAFCREVMRSHGGTIHATERDGRVCFVVQLPRSSS